MLRTLVAGIVAIALVAGCGSEPATPVGSGSVAPVTDGPATATASAPAASATHAASPAPTLSPASIELTVFAAASLRAVLDELIPAYEAATPGTTVTLATDSSATLAAQIEQGAPADVFLSADSAWPQRLIERGLVAGEARTFATNRPAIIVPAAHPTAVDEPADLAAAGVRIVAAGDGVPITTYAGELVAQLAALPGYPADFAAGYERNVVSREDNVTTVLTKVGLGEGDAGIVYATDAAGSAAVETIELPTEIDVTARYAGAVVGASPHQEGARTFLGWLTGPEAQAILASFGFLPPS